MNKPFLFWIACASLLFVLSLLWLHQDLHPKNRIFTVWLLCSVAMQLVAAWGLALHRPYWFMWLGRTSGIATALLAAASIALAAARWGCPVNRVIVLGLGGMLLLQFGSELLAGAGAARVWIRNVGFFGPSMYMLISFSGARMDRLPLWAGWISDFRFQISEALGRAAARALLG